MVNGVYGAGLVLHTRFFFFSAFLLVAVKAVGVNQGRWLGNKSNELIEAITLQRVEGNCRGGVIIICGFITTG